VGLFRRKRKVGAAGIPGTARVVDVDTSDFWRTTPNNDHFHLAEIGLGHVVNRLTLEITLNDGRDAYQVTDDFKVQTRGGTPMTIPVGSTAVRSVIEQVQPLVGLHGHVHDSRGACKLGRTLCINPGSDYPHGILRGAILSIKNGKVKGWTMSNG